MLMWFDSISVTMFKFTRKNINAFKHELNVKQTYFFFL